jgi:hypothetical protein
LVFRLLASSYTLRPHLGLNLGSEGSGARFEFPKNYFVWDFQKIDSRPYKRCPVLHIFSILGENHTFFFYESHADALQGVIVVLIVVVMPYR